MNKKHRIRYNSDSKRWEYFLEKRNFWTPLEAWLNYKAYKEHVQNFFRTAK